MPASDPDRSGSGESVPMVVDAAPAAAAVAIADEPAPAGPVAVRRKVQRIDRREAAAAAPVVAQLEDTPDDPEAATHQTVQMMARYINDALQDPFVLAVANQACAVFSRGRRDPQSAAWGVFWFLRHRIKKALDEATMWRVGMPNQQDLLISPSVLLRMKDPVEDCDGFTMVALALLSALGVVGCMVTVACDAADRTRWSHVFAMVQLPNGTWMPLDCSHGLHPGWMVPRHHIFRWQAWGLDGSPIEAKPAMGSSLRGYVFRGRGMNGLGDPCDITSTDYNIDSCLGITPDFPGLPNAVSTSLPTAGSFSCPSMEQLLGITDATDPCQGGAVAPAAGSAAGSSPSSSGTNTNWLTALFGSTLPAAAKSITAATLQPGQVMLPNGTIINTGSGAAALNLASGGGSALLLIGGGLLGLWLLSSLMGGRK
jgi:hypothetical protein